jgi:GNAT superfamily N-acetyltransferase
MLEKDLPSAQIFESSAENLFGGEWEGELLFRSRERILIEGKLGEKVGGKLAASFVVSRDYDEETNGFVEVGRAVDIGDLMVYKGFRGKGLGKAMLAELERVSNRVGASEIRGKVTDSDVAETPWLLKFYEDRGFTVEPRGAGWEIRKVLIAG